jgi:hypothetical protein
VTGDLPPVHGDHNRVEPGDAIGIAIRVPMERVQVVVDLLAPGVPPELVLRQRDDITVYPTIGRDLLNGRPVTHRWVNLIADAPPGVPADEAIGGIACIGAESSPISRMWWRQGLGTSPSTADDGGRAFGSRPWAGP